MPGTVEGTSIIQDGYSPYKVNGRDAGDPLKQTIQNVGNFSILYTAAALGAVAAQTTSSRHQQKQLLQLQRISTKISHS